MPTTISGIITGTIVDAGTKEKVQFASISLAKEKDGELITGCLSNENGGFVLKDIDPGRYIVKVSFMGYEKFESDIINILLGSKPVRLNEVLLKPMNVKIDEVNIVADIAPISYKIDRKVINAAGFSSASGGTAVHILENTPSVEVDIQGNVKLRGSGNFIVYENGKPTVFQGSDALDMIPASIVDRIEIITNPSAKYDPDGTAGIINVITKENINRDVAGIFNFKASSVGSIGADVILKKKFEKVQWFLGGSFNEGYRNGNYNEWQKTSGENLVETQTIGDRINRMYRLSGKGGIEYDFSSKDNLMISIEGGTGGRESTAELMYDTKSVFEGEILDSLNSLSYSEVNNDRDFFGSNLNYAHMFNNDGHKLDFALYYRSSSATEPASDRVEEEGDVISGQQSDKIDEQSNIQAKLDYVLPYNNKKGKFQAGFHARKSDSEGEYQFDTYNTTTGKYDERPEYYNSFKFDHDIYALYLMNSNEIGVLGYQLGLRAEYTDREIGNSRIENNYMYERLDLFPTAHFTFNFSGENQFMMSYTRRINRPRGGYFEPYVTLVDSRRARVGNPEIKPEYLNSYELGYQKRFGELFFSTELYFKEKFNKIEKISRAYSPGVVLDSVANIGKDYSLGIEMLTMFNPSPWWRVNLSGSAFKYRVDVFETITKESLSWRARCGNSFSVNDKTRIQLDFIYRSSTENAFSSMDEMFMTNLSARRDFFKRKLTATVSVMDILGTAKYEMNSFGNGVERRIKIDPLTPQVFLTLSYKINNFKQDGKINNGNNMEMPLYDDY
jgi:outer membrane receptor protein involved in Fe transport